MESAQSDEISFYSQKRRSGKHDNYQQCATCNMGQKVFVSLPMELSMEITKLFTHIGIIIIAANLR